MSKHTHISAIFDKRFQSRANSPDVYMSMHVIDVVPLSGRYIRSFRTVRIPGDCGQIIRPCAIRSKSDKNGKNWLLIIKEIFKTCISNYFNKLFFTWIKYKQEMN